MAYRINFDKLKVNQPLYAPESSQGQSVQELADSLFVDSLPTSTPEASTPFGSEASTTSDNPRMALVNNPPDVYQASMGDSERTYQQQIAENTPAPVLPDNVNPQFAQAHPDLTTLLGAASYPIKRAMENPWMQRAGQTGSEVVTMTDRPDKVSTGSTAGDVSADLLGFIMGAAENPVSAGSKALKGTGLLAERYLPKLSNPIADLATKGAAMSVPYDIGYGALNNGIDPRSVAINAAASAGLNLLPYGVGRALANKQDSRLIPNIGGLERKLEGAAEKIDPGMVQQDLEQPRPTQTRPILPIAAEKFSLVPGKTRAEQTNAKVQQALEEWNRKNLGIAKKETQAQTKAQMNDMLAGVGKRQEQWLGEKFMPKADRQQELKNSIGLNRPSSPEEVAGIAKRQIPVNPREGYISSDNKGVFLRPLTQVKPKTEMPPRLGEPLPQGVGAASLRTPSTIETITSKSERGPVDVGNTIRAAYQKSVDSLNRLNDVDNYVAKTTGKKLAPQDKTYMAAMNQKGADQTARFILEEGLRDSKDKVVGPSFKEVVQKVPKGTWREFEDYLKLNHFKAWEKQGMEVYDKNLNMNEVIANKKIAEYEAKYPWMKQAAKDYTGWINQFGEKWLVDTGLVSKEQWQAMRTLYKDYIPFQRLMDESELGITGAKAGFANQPNPVKRALGSERKTIESIETMIERIPAYVKAAKRNEVMQKLIGFMKSDAEGMAPWGEIVTSDTANLTMKNVVAGRINGERIHVRLNDPQLLEALTKLSPQGQNAVVEFVRQGTRIMKMLTTGVNPVFSLARNIFRDLPMSYVSSKSTNNPAIWAKDLVGSLVDIVGNKEMYKSFKAMGGGHSSSIAADRNILAESKARIQPGYFDPSKPAQMAGRLGKAAFGGLERLANVTETMPRLGEYRRIVRQGGGSYESKVKGLFEANDITVNFNRSGDVSRSADAFIPYFNAAVQGLDKLGRIFKDNPVQATGKAIAAITVPTVALYAHNHNDPNYQRLSQWTKDNYFCIPKGNGTFIKIPKPRETGVIFGALPERVLRQWQDRDPNAFEGFAETIKTNFVPPTRTILAPIGDIRANKNFIGAPIVPGYMENLSPKLQYDENTSNPAKWIGDKLNISPKQADYLIRSYTGVIGQLGIPALSEGGSVKETLIRQVTADPVYSNDVVTKFYDKKKKLDTSASDAKYTGGQAESQDEKFRKLYGKIGDTISDTRDKMRKIEKNPALTPEAKKEQLRGMQAAIVTMADIANKSTDEQTKLYNDLKRKGKIVETKPKSAGQIQTDQRKADKTREEMTSLFTR